METKRSIYQTFLNTAVKYPNCDALIYMNRHFKYLHVLKRINQFAQGLLDIGVKKDDPVTICLPNIPDAIYLVYAVNQIGAIANILHPLVNYHQMAENIEETKTKFVFCLETHYPTFKPLEAMGVRIIACEPTNELSIFEKIGYKIPRNHKIKHVSKQDLVSQFYKKQPYNGFDRRYDNDAIYLHSGGTSGKAKIIALSSFAMNSLATAIPWIVQHTNRYEKYGMLSVLPMFHGFGLEVGVHYLFCVGGHNVIEPKFNRNQTIRYLSKGYINIIIGVPVLYEALLGKKSFSGKKLKHLELSFVGGDFVPSSLIEAYNKRMEEAGSINRMFEGYGLTETVCVCAVNTHYHNKKGTSGTAIPVAKFKVVDPVTLKDLGYDKEGELLISGDMLLNHYVFAEEGANEKLFVYDKDGTKWIRTGDFCSLDSENFVTFKQRLKRIIKVNGVPVFPSMVEDCAHKFDFVYECAAIGVEDAKRGHMIKLFVVLHREYKGSQEEPKEKIIKKINDDLGVYAKPKEVVFLEKLPHTMVGKIDTKLLK